MEAPRSSNSLLKVKFPIVQGTVKVSRSFHFYDILSYMRADTFLPMLTLINLKTLKYPSTRDILTTLQREHLAKKFEMKELGPLKYFLGIEVSRSKLGMTTCKPTNSPTEGGLKLCIKEDQTPTNKERYHRLVGKLLHLAHTKSNLTYTLSVISQFMHNPSEKHMDAVIRISRYIKTTPEKGVMFKKNSNYQDVMVYTNADWASALDDRRSIFGYFTFVEGNLVT
ncbi:uncharacterized protein LOC113871438 [Abrus precatorius]|uniref:Uncharacterized protein LOC113871438 n=1 Tax=Abrus precatorius TaxID=3816 RepID=A0A8B8M6N4_ABRPR|nr:uncharacterized protein LOC113871438 [Abrus precatorius]